MATSCGSDNVIAHRKDAENAEKVFSFLLSPANTNGIKGQKGKNNIPSGEIRLEYLVFFTIPIHISSIHQPRRRLNGFDFSVISACPGKFFTEKERSGFNRGVSSEAPS